MSEEPSQSEESKSETETGERTPFDALLKHLADHFAPDLLSFLHQTGPLLRCESVGGEVEITHRLSDRFWKVSQEHEGTEYTYLMHMEFEAEYDPHIGRRLGMYGWGLFEKEKLPVSHLVWWVGGKRPSYWPKEAWYRQQRLEMTPRGQVTAFVEWREIWLPGGFQAEQFLQSAPPYLLPFAVLMEGMEPPLLVRLHNAILGSGLSEDHKQDLLVMAVFFASRSFALTEIMEIFDMADIEQNPLAQHLVEKGRQEGLQKGIQEGLLLKAKEVAAQLLQQGFEVEAILKLTGLSAEQLKELQEPPVTVDDN